MRPGVVFEMKLRARLPHCQVLSESQPASRTHPDDWKMFSLVFRCAPGCSLCASSTRRADSRSHSRTGSKQGEQKQRTGPLLCSSWRGRAVCKTRSGARAGRGPDPVASYDNRRLVPF